MRIELMYTDLQSAASPLRQLAAYGVPQAIAIGKSGGKWEVGDGL